MWKSRSARQNPHSFSAFLARFRYSPPRIPIVTRGRARPSIYAVRYRVSGGEDISMKSWQRFQGNWTGAGIVIVSSSPKRAKMRHRSNGADSRPAIKTALHIYRLHLWERGQSWSAGTGSGKVDFDSVAQKRFSFIKLFIEFSNPIHFPRVATTKPRSVAHSRITDWLTTKPFWGDQKDRQTFHCTK